MSAEHPAASKPRNGYAFRTIRSELRELQEELRRVRDAITDLEFDLDRKHEQEAALMGAIAMTERGLQRLEADDAE